MEILQTSTGDHWVISGQVQKGMSALPPIATAKADMPQMVMSALRQKKRTLGLECPAKSENSSINGQGVQRW